MRKGLGTYAIGVALGFTSEEVQSYVWADENECSNLLHTLSLESGIRVGFLIQKIEISMNHTRKTRKSFIEYLLTLSPRGVRVVLNIKGHQYAPGTKL